jgi:SAM-dependent methyltransferase
MNREVQRHQHRRFQRGAATNPLLHSRLATQVTAAVPTPAALRALVREAADSLRANPKEAERRAREAGLANVSFAVHDLSDLTLTGPVDALIGRLVLMYLDDPAAALRRLLDSVAPGGVVAFQEMDMGAATCEPDCPLFAATGERIIQTSVRAGLDHRTGLKLARICRDAGLPAPQTLQGARVESGPESLVYAYLAQTTRTLLPLMERTGVATAAEVGIDTLETRLREAVAAADAAVVPPPLIGAWTRTPV